MVKWTAGLDVMPAANWQMAQCSRSRWDGTAGPLPVGWAAAVVPQQQRAAGVCLPSSVTAPRVWPGRTTLRNTAW